MNSKRKPKKKTKKKLQKKIFVCKILTINCFLGFSMFEYSMLTNLKFMRYDYENALTSSSVLYIKNPRH